MRGDKYLEGAAGKEAACFISVLSGAQSHFLLPAAGGPKGTDPEIRWCLRVSARPKNAVMWKSSI